MNEEDVRTRRILAAMSKVLGRLDETSDVRIAMRDLLPEIGVAAEVDRVRFVDEPHIGGAAGRRELLEWQIDRGVVNREVLADSDLSPLFDQCFQATMADAPVKIGVESSEILLVPVTGDRRGRGFLAFESFSSSGEWSEVDIALLGLIGVAVTKAMAREDSMAERMQAERMAALGRMSGGVAHDLNNLLTVFTATAELSRLGLETGEPMRRTALENLDTADRAMARAAELLRTLTGFSGRAEGSPEVIRVDSFLTSMEPCLSKMVGRGVRFELDIEPGLDESAIRMDRGQFKNAIVTLIKNARDSMPDGGRVRVLLGPGDSTPGGIGSTMTVRVVDDGIGMTEGVRARVFEPFFTTKPREQGAGMALASVYASVHAIGGRITVDSVPDLGTSFRLDLPCWVDEPAVVEEVVSTESGV